MGATDGPHGAEAPKVVEELVAFLIFTLQLPERIFWFSHKTIISCGGPRNWGQFRRTMKRGWIASMLIIVLVGGVIVRRHRRRVVMRVAAARISEAQMQFCHVRADRAVNTGAFENDSSAANSMWERAYNDCLAQRQRMNPSSTR